MESTEFIEKCQEIIIESFRDYHEEESDKVIQTEDVLLVWFSKTLNHKKALFTTTLEDSPYFEATLNGSSNEIYLDIYKKHRKIVYTEQ